MISKDATTPFPGISPAHHGDTMHSNHHARLWQGAGWKILSMACFALINGIVRYCSGGAGALDMAPLPINVMVFFQNLFGTLCLLPWIIAIGKI